VLRSTLWGKGGGGQCNKQLSGGWGHPVEINSWGGGGSLTSVVEPDVFLWAPAPTF
jgi:uncharacterized membrane protein